jgi:hypothetical protein
MLNPNMALAVKHFPARIVLVYLLLKYRRRTSIHAPQHTQSITARRATPSRALAHDNRKGAARKKEAVLEPALPRAVVERGREAHIEAAHERREHRAHLAHRERAPNAVPRACRAASAFAAKMREGRARTVVERHPGGLIQLELGTARLGELRALGRPALGPERVRIRREVARVAMHYATRQLRAGR